MKGIVLMTQTTDTPIRERLKVLLIEAFGEFYAEAKKRKITEDMSDITQKHAQRFQAYIDSIVDTVVGEDESIYMDESKTDVDLGIKIGIQDCIGKQRQRYAKLKEGGKKSV